MFTKENAKEIGRKGGLSTMSKPGNASRIGSAGGRASGKQRGQILGKLNVENGVLARAQQVSAERRTGKKLKSWYTVLLNVDEVFTTADVVEAMNNQISIGSVKALLRNEEGCVRLRQGVYRKNQNLL